MYGTNRKTGSRPKDVCRRISIINLMIVFKDLTLYDKDLITSYTLHSNYRNCDLSFSNLCSWRFLYHTTYAVINGFLVFKFWLSNDRMSYMQPVGDGDIKELLDMLIVDATMEGQDFRMLGICPKIKAELENILPDKLAFTYARDYSDYIYLREDLATLIGKRYQPKRNHINRFKKEYTYRYAPITPDAIRDCLLLEAEWQKANKLRQGEDASDENQAVFFALNHFEELGLTGGILYANDKAAAFTYGMPISQDTFGVHVEKADAAVNGAYSMINYEFANRIPKQYTYVNREEDLGIEGLRKAKLSYYPEIILDKYVAHSKKESIL
ncbi:hypothetical protein EZS27_023602 [termite gut metagenome]|uniref:Phosphatidylglycerol lysyltransferase C-terminal domain-containing protein n=1 Tax=termite gut metagenome TaxID=433724 RepID=A0A5J4R0B2_9ZZZZ